VEISELIKSNLKENDALVIDFVDWESSYFLALESGVNKERLFLVNGTANAQLDVYNLRETINKSKRGIIIVNHGSDLQKLIEKSKSALSDSIELFAIKTCKSYSVLRFDIIHQ